MRAVRLQRLEFSLLGQTQERTRTLSQGLMCRVGCAARSIVAAQ